MKKIATRLLYVFSFSLLFVALYLNLFSNERGDASPVRMEKKATLPSTVAQPENNTVLK